MSLLRWLGLEDESRAVEADSLVEIERALDDLPPEEARVLACFAYILGRVARADEHISADESGLMARLVAEHGSVDAARAGLVVRIATAQGLRHGGTDDYIVSRTFAEVATDAQKLALLRCLFAVSAADASIRTVEDNVMRQIAAEIRVDPAAFQAERAAYRARYAVLRRTGDAT